MIAQALLSGFFRASILLDVLNQTSDTRGPPGAALMKVPVRSGGRSRFGRL